MLTLAEASQAPETKVFWSGPIERLMTSPVCPLNVTVGCPDSMSHSELRGGGRRGEGGGERKEVENMGGKTLNIRSCCRRTVLLGPHDGHYTHTQQLLPTNHSTSSTTDPQMHRPTRSHTHCPTGTHRPRTYQVMSPEEVRIRESSRNRQEER